uniref:(northern house mosquito) hypothetical protein n=1 Tax=Culex pipiens TaxID=7175 RepID=A0A8D8A4C7_CULPI
MPWLTSSATPFSDSARNSCPPTRFTTDRIGHSSVPQWARSMIGIWLVDSRVSIFSSLPGLPPPPPPLPLLSMFAHLDSMVLLCFKRRFWDFFLLQRSVSSEERNFFSLSLFSTCLLWSSL